MRARRAAASGSLPPSGLAVIGALAGRLADGEFDDEAPPARLHGDLWAGNVLFSGDSATLIDPAAHGGHRITDLAMLALFGLPYLEEVFGAYEASSRRLPSGWRDLIGLHQLHPLLVHAVLFGGGYGDRAVSVARGY
jgi:fructosamine-3-kinase